ncbi:MAG TPA: hypothetical protein VM261_19995 [Kofleriaceae bacterium]|nr:hypothetical protein [Kofleriaceae bacterium]
MRRLLLAVTTLLFLANCNRAAAPSVAGGALVLTGAIVMGTAGEDNREEDGHSWNLGPSSSELQSVGGAALIATGAVLFLAGVVKAGKERDREQEAARRAEQAELETWRAKLNTVAAANQ